MRSCASRSWMIAGAIAGCAWSTAAHADQCAVLDETAAARAVDALRRHPDIVSFCEPCGDAAPGVPVRLSHATARRIAGGFEVVVDGHAIDLAYAYAQTSSHRYDNLAALVACPTTGVSPSLAIDDATSTGVLIHADPRPVRHEPAVERAPAALPIAPAAPAPGPTIYVVTPASNPGVGWDGVVLACGLTFAVWWLGAGLRRRRTMRPRATDL
jgi:hypothetical protein